MISSQAYISTGRKSGSSPRGSKAGGYVVYSEEETARFLSKITYTVSAPVIPDRIDIFSPQNFSEYVGQAEAKAMAKIMMNAANKESRNLPNIMIISGFGLGKTTLAKLILQGVWNGPNGTSAQVMDAASIMPGNLPSSGTVIIDEMHNLKAEIADSLNQVLDTGKLTIIGCTTNPGMVPVAFRSRFRSIYLEQYSIDDLVQILTKICARKHVSADRARLVEIAQRSRNNARSATNNIGFIFDYMISSGVKLNKSIIELAFSMLGIDKKGYLKRDHKYVEALFSEKPVGLQYLASKVGIDAKTIEEEVEPYLLQNGIIDRTPKGRIKLKDI